MRFWQFSAKVLGVVFAASVFLGCEDARRPSASSQENVSSPEQWDLEPPASVVAQLRHKRAANPGLTLFEHYCSACHGAEGKGDGQYYSDSLDAKPVDLTNRQAADRFSEDHLTKVIREGSVGVGKSALCPPWDRVLSDLQVAVLVKHVQQLATASDESQ